MIFLQINGSKVAMIKWFAILLLSTMLPFGKSFQVRAQSIQSIQNNKNVSLVGRWTVGPCKAVNVSGNYAYIGYAGFLDILDISNPQKPVSVGRGAMTYPAEAIAISNNYAYVADGAGGLRIFDVQNPGQPKEVGHYDTGGDAADVAVSGGYAYVAEGENLLIIDVNNPVQPKEKGYYIAGNTVEKVVVSAGYAYMTDQGHLLVIDVSDPVHPQKIGAEAYDTLTQNSFMSDISVVNGYVYIAEDNSLDIIDVTDPGNPLQAGSYHLPPGNLPSYPVFYRVRNVTVSGNYAYTSGGGGLGIFDVSDPGNIQEVGSYANGAGSLVVSGQYVYGVSDDGLSIIDVGNPNQPKATGFYETGRNAEGLMSMAVSGGYAYIVDSGAYIDSTNSLRVVNITDPNNPKEVSSYKMGTGLIDVAVSGNYLYVTEGKGSLNGSVQNIGDSLIVFDISNPGQLNESGSYHITSWPKNMTASGNYVYMLTGSDFLVMDVSDPAHPHDVGLCDLGGSVDINGMMISGGYAYVGADYGGLRVIDISDPAQPSEVGFYTKGTRYYTPGVTVSNGYAYLDAHGYLLVIDINDPTQPMEVGYYDTGDFSESDTYRIAVSGKYAYLGGDGRIHVIDVSDPTQPREVGFYNMNPGDIVATDKYVYVTDPTAGLYILQNNLSAPIQKTVNNNPDKFVLDQNYPNPFNPTTVIHYNLQSTNKVKLQVYNTLGQLVSTLVDQMQTAGPHAIHFDAHDLPSGMYIYRLKAGNYTETKKMMLIK